MVFVVGTVVLSALVVIITRGSFERLIAISLRGVWLLLAGFVLQLVLEFVDFPDERIDDVGFGLLLFSYGLIVAFCILNWNLLGMKVVTIGVLLNVLVITLNQGMPTKDDVVERNGRDVRVPIERTVKHRPEEDDDLLPFLGDVLTVPGLPNQQFSIGDVVIGIGVAQVCYGASRRPRRDNVTLTQAGEPA